MQRTLALVTLVCGYIKKDMSIFTKKVNSLTGRAAWELLDENYDFHQEIARSAFADMLHDTERNEKYYEAIRMAVERMHKMGKPANVLDIGTGTGLLSMMAARCGADTIVACEVFAPMADCAKKIITRNGFSDKIKVICKRSTDLIVGEDGDLKHKANILVTEVFDTELIGEGALAVFNHAHKELLEEDCIVVPSSGTLYCQVVESGLGQQWNKLNSIQESAGSSVILDTPPKIWNCPGTAAVHDIQLSQFPENEFRTIISPRPVMRFDWSGRSSLLWNCSNTVVSKAECNGVAQLVFVWWDLKMDEDNIITLSCAPIWAHPLTVKRNIEDNNTMSQKQNELPWRDHWMQAVYYLPKEVTVSEGEELMLSCTHDEFSFWFDVYKNISVSEEYFQRPVCECGLHARFSRTRIGAMNDTRRTYKYIAALKQHITKDSICLCLSEGTLLGLVAAKLGAQKVYCIDGNELSKCVMNEYIKHNNLESVVELLDSVEEISKREDLIEQITFVFGEPHFSTALLPWHNVYFWYMKQEVSHLLAKNVGVLPVEATIWAMGVEFKDLYKIRAPLSEVEGFCMTEFDEIIEHSSSISDNSVEAHPLWEYPCRALTQPIQILEFRFNKEMGDSPVKNEGKVLCETSGACHGVVVWVDWDLDGNPKNTITTGPIEMVAIGDYVKWDMHTRQGVYFLPRFEEIFAEKESWLHFAIEFLPQSDGLNFHFHIKTE